MSRKALGERILRHLPEIPPECAVGHGTSDSIQCCVLQRNVRELAEGGVLEGKSGACTSTADVAEVSVPATLRATIGARIDLLDPKAKRPLSAAAVIGSRVSRDLLATLSIDPALQDLVGAECFEGHMKSAEAMP